MGALKCLLLYRLLHVGTFLVSTYFKKKLPNRVYEASNFFLHHVIVITLLLRSSTIKVAADHRIRREKGHSFFMADHTIKHQLT